MDGNSVGKFVSGFNTNEKAAKIYAGTGAMDSIGSVHPGQNALMRKK